MTFREPVLQPVRITELPPTQVTLGGFRGATVVVLPA